MEPSPYDRSANLAAAPAGYDGGNLGLAILAGLIAALLGAILWAVLVSATGIKIGFAAVGIGFLVGWAMRGAGKGHSPAYGYAGAVLSLLGCVLGDLLTDCMLVGQHAGRPLMDVLSHLNPGTALMLLQAGFQPLDALFYFIAVSAGYRNAFSKH